MSTSTQQPIPPEKSGNPSVSATVAPQVPKKAPVRQGAALPQAKGRFNIEIVSVYYFFEGESTCAAVVIRTSFELPDKRLKYAKCPIAVSQKVPDDNQEPLDPLSIRRYFPEQQEFVQVKYHTGTREWFFEPSVELLEVGAQVGGIKSARSDNKPTVISLQTIHDQEATPRISWSYEDKEKSRYPGVVDVLLVVENPNAGAHPWFEFRLQLTKDLKVDVHSNMPSWYTDFKDRLVGVPEPGQEGWFFNIRGAYKVEKAQAVLDSLQRPNVPVVGLKAASQPMIEALSPPPGTRPLTSPLTSPTH